MQRKRRMTVGDVIGVAAAAGGSLAEASAEGLAERAAILHDQERKASAKKKRVKSKKKTADEQRGPNFRAKWTEVNEMFGKERLSDPRQSLLDMFDVEANGSVANEREGSDSDEGEMSEEPEEEEQPNSSDERFVKADEE